MQCIMLRAWTRRLPARYRCAHLTPRSLAARTRWRCPRSMRSRPRRSPTGSRRWPTRRGCACSICWRSSERVRERYAEAAQRVRDGGGGCCGGSSDVVTTDLYGDADVAGLPEEAVLASLGCGNPTALIDLREGETVLDLGSGGGIDVLLSAKRVGPTGKAYGLDMTDEMLALANQNKRRAGAANVEFLKGEIQLN